MLWKFIYTLPYWMCPPRLGQPQYTSKPKSVSYEGFVQLSSVVNLSNMDHLKESSKIPSYNPRTLCARLDLGRLGIYLQKKKPEPASYSGCISFPLASVLDGRLHGGIRGSHDVRDASYTRQSMYVCMYVGKEQAQADTIRDFVKPNLPT
jgi:hypothetical protein